MKDAPTVAVVVPTRDRPARLAACLAALARQDYPPGRFEAVVVDDGSRRPGPVAAVAAAAPAALGVRLLAREHGGPAAARNHGALSTDAELIAFTDDDCAPEPGWLLALARALAGAPGAVAGGRTLNGLPGAFCPEASQLLLEHVVDWFMEAGRPFFASNNLALPAALFAELGGFDPGFHLAAGEDREFCDRAFERGVEFRPARGAVVRHCHRLGPIGFTRQHFNYGRGAWRFRLRRARRGSGGVRIEPPRFYAALLARPFRAGRGLAAVPLSLLLGWSQAANAAGFFYERWIGARR